jgi:hypothetical protein
MSESKSEFNGETFIFTINPFAKEGEDPIVADYLDAPPNLIPENKTGEDFVLTGEHAWIRVGNFSIRINDTGSALKVGVWKKGDEHNDPIEQIKVNQDDGE